MEFVEAYSSTSEGEDNLKKRKITKPDIPGSPSSQPLVTPTPSFMLLNEIDICPDADITDLISKQEYDQSRRFYIDNQITEKFNHLTGHCEEYYANIAKFEEQYYSFSNTGMGLNPAIGNEVVGSLGIECTETQRTYAPPTISSKETKERRKEVRKKRKAFGDPSQGEFLGPWAHYEGEKSLGGSHELTEEQNQYLREVEEKRRQKVEESKGEEEAGRAGIRVSAKSVLHIDVERNYQGKSFLHPSVELKPYKHVCYIPRKWMHTYTGHAKGVQCTRLFPRSGHLLMTGSLDNKIKLWDVLTHRKCVRTYMGHTQAVRDICFNRDGGRFISGGFDKSVLLWDTEYGKVIRAFTNQRFPYVLKFNPDSDKQNIFLVGASNKKIVQYDTNTGEMTQQYDEHMGAINTITFIDGNKRFVSTADDKKIFIWEFGIPVVVKHVSEPDMNAIPAAALHPNGKYFAGQSMDNKIVIYDCKGNFKMNRKKKFTGHVNAGYACGLSFSPDGKFLASGDSEGKLWFWDWKTCKNYRTMKVHESVVIDTIWHPLEPSKVITGSWDSTAKLWD